MTRKEEGALEMPWLVCPHPSAWAPKADTQHSANTARGDSKEPLPLSSATLHDQQEARYAPSFLR